MHVTWTIWSFSKSKRDGSDSICKGGRCCLLLGTELCKLSGLHDLVVLQACKYVSLRALDVGGVYEDGGAVMRG